MGVLNDRQAWAVPYSVPFTEDPTHTVTKTPDCPPHSIPFSGRRMFVRAQDHQAEVLSVPQPPLQWAVEPCSSQTEVSRGDRGS
jgi:hypothetical protein